MGKSVKVMVAVSVVLTSMVVLVGLLGIYQLNGPHNDMYVEGSSVVPADKALLIGSWVEPNPIDSSQVQGFTLNEDGTASSINMETLKYSKWWVEPGRLVLVSSSIGNGISFTDTTSCPIMRMGKGTLDIKYGNLKRSYRRRE